MPPDAALPTGRLRAVAVLVLFVATFMDLLDTTIVNVALPAIQGDLQASPSQLEWIVSGYVLAFATVLITMGRLGDLYGRKRIFLIGVVGFTVASGVAAFAPTADVLVVSRIVQGVFAATMVPQVLSIVQVLYSPKDRAGVLGALGAVTGLAAVAGPLLSGVLVTHDVAGLEWRSIFVINLPIGALLLVGGSYLIPETRSPRRTSIDVAGVVVSSLALFLVVFALIEGRPKGWAWWIWALMAVAAVLLVAFVRHERQVEQRGVTPLVPPSLFRDRGYTAGSLTSLAFFGSIGAFFFIVTLYLQLGLGFTPISSALATLPFSVGAFLASGASVPLVDKVGKALVTIGLSLFTLAVAWTAQTIAHHGDALSTWDLTGPMFLGGVGLAFAAVPLLDVSLANIDVQNAGAASGVLGTFQQVGGAVLLAIVGVVFFESVGAGQSSDAWRNGVLHGLLVPGIGLAVGAVASLLLPGVEAVRHHKDMAEKAAELDYELELEAL
ncbi:MFS transporter [Nocardioides rubriscoriae]|uniref:MFS transporter n=1 Tax=Nocardioides rubriscoriae TaxID=642762 RepID=UPI0011DF3BAA|nr:MFS transporter [Nocardioides rubriscoriae]